MLAVRIVHDVNGLLRDLESTFLVTLTETDFQNCSKAFIFIHETKQGSEDRANKYQSQDVNFSV